MKLKDPIAVRTLDEGPFGRMAGPQAAFVVAVDPSSFTLQSGRHNLGTKFGKALYRRSDGVRRGHHGRGHTDTRIVQDDFAMLSQRFPLEEE